MCSTDEWHMYPKRERRLRCFQADSTVYLLPLHLYSGRSYSSWTSLEVATMLHHLADQKQMAKSKWQTKPPSSINPCTVNCARKKKKKKRENNNPKCISLSRARGKRQEATQIPRDSFSDMPTVSSINLAIYACSLFYAVVIET